MKDLDPNALDRYITGNYGEDQYPVKNYEMFSEAGNEAVAEMLDFVRAAYRTDSTVRNKKTLAAFVRPQVELIAAVHPEVYDTEPRNHIFDALDAICKEEGWVWDIGWGWDI